MIAALWLGGTVGAQQSYRGFSVDSSALGKQPDLSAILTSTEEQIDMVHAVGLPAEILTFCQSVKFKLVPPGAFESPTPGRYTGKRGHTVEVSANIVRVGHKPVLLHELLHAYHDQRVAQGFANPAVLALYEAAKAIPAFAAKSHMMANAKEYFACTATTYLYGITAQEPFTREKLRESQPACFAYLQAIFGTNAGRYQGSLTFPPSKEPARPGR